MIAYCSATNGEGLMAGVRPIFTAVDLVIREDNLADYSGTALRKRLRQAIGALELFTELTNHSGIAAS